MADSMLQTSTRVYYVGREYLDRDQRYRRAIGVSIEAFEVVVEDLEGRAACCGHRCRAASKFWDGLDFRRICTTQM
jgi:hypothetical protein